MKNCFLKRVFSFITVACWGCLMAFGGVVTDRTDEQFGESYTLQEGDDIWTVFVYKVSGSQWTFNLPEGATKFEALVVGAGGGGGGLGGGGGGAVYENRELPVVPGAYTVTVGTGGTGATDPFKSGGKGGNTILSGQGLSVTAVGGGGGIGWNGEKGWNGANGGGGSPGSPIKAPESGSEPPDEHYHQGFTGGTATNTGSGTTGCGGGGGGAGAGGNGGDSQILNTAANNDPTEESSGAGGVGYESSLSGVATYYGGGGGGGVRRSNYKIGGAGGLGGGGSGSTGTKTTVVKGSVGVDGLGGGGGGGGWDKGQGNNTVTALAGQRGGDGVVVLRYVVPGGDSDDRVTVTFFGMDGSELESYSVRYDTSMQPPSAGPEVPGYIFIGWDVTDFSFITAPLEVHAIYKKLHTVVFYGKDGEELKREEVIDGESATAPEPPAVSEYAFVRWSVDFSTVHEPLAVNAVYVELIIARFVDSDGTVLEEKITAAGAVPSAPAEPLCDGKVFVGWSPALVPITQTTVFTACYATARLGERTDEEWGYSYRATLGRKVYQVTVVTNTESVWSIPCSASDTFDALIVGGGGGGGGLGGGGGGAVYCRYGIPVPTGAFSVTVGKGGGGAVANPADIANSAAPFHSGGTGGASLLAAEGLETIEAFGGGGGLGYGPHHMPSTIAVANGGGAAPTDNSCLDPASGTVAPTPWHHQGFTGGRATNKSLGGQGCGAGGGGAGADGDGVDSQVLHTAANNDKTVEPAGAGGDGYRTAFSGEVAYYGGGGGGGVRRSNYKVGGRGGLGGGGSGSTGVKSDASPGIVKGTPGVDGLGGGGGAGGWDKDGGDGIEGCDGGSGVVMLRWCVKSGDPLLILVR